MLRVERVEVVKKGYALRPVCTVVGGDCDGTKVCCGMYDFSAERVFALRNVLASGVTRERLDATGGDVEKIGELLIGRVGRVYLRVFESRIGSVNSHVPGGVTEVKQ